ncbi:RNA methyltransferase [Actomonas aquatica]|uniref:RNA methyltransferase n=1 Tax=Actomonas aquatica TaxID=2866162 RepID=A0ABZ1C5M6_9BACT|nr:RNA methyltransferase [Opitutus sp. WL0086]WRQ87042.1 RNA methyltransferase [Opitutus sp. WL0086]
MKSKATLNLCGLAAVSARWARDPDSVQRLFFDYATGRKIGAMTKAMAQARKVYRCVEPAELEKIAGSVHHGGIVAVVDAPRLASPVRGDPERWARERVPVLVLDRIGNAHNLGAVARTAAFFGVKHIIIPDTPEAAKPNDAAFRVAEGGLEALTVWQPRNLVALLRDMEAAGYELVGAATRDGRDRVSEIEPGKPVAILLGNEEHGLSPELDALCTRRVTLAGSGAVESLNVSVAGAILMDRVWGR